jgi:hypothetical protein
MIVYDKFQCVLCVGQEELLRKWPIEHDANDSVGKITLRDAQKPLIDIHVIVLGYE